MSKNEIEISIKLPSIKDVLQRKPKVYLNVRGNCDGVPPFTKEALKQANGYAGKTGVYVHIWEKEDGEKVIRYVGETGNSFRERLNRELTLQNGQCSKYFIENLTVHVGKHNLATVFFDDDEIRKMVTVPDGINPSSEALRLLVEQAMAVAYSSPDMLNVRKTDKKQ